MLNPNRLSPEQFAGLFDLAVLKPDATGQDTLNGCELARKYQIASVCVKPCYVALAAKALDETKVAVGTVIGFPHGSHTTATKVFEAQDAMRNGAVELDMVLNVGELKSGNTTYVRDDIRAVVGAAGGKAIVKVIFENALLTPEEIIQACHASEAAGADYIKTSTGFAAYGARIEDIRLMRANVSPKMGIKAAGGLKNLDMVLAAVEAGSNRIGISALESVMQEFQHR